MEILCRFQRMNISVVKKVVISLADCIQKKSATGKAEECTTNTDAVDREIEKLKEEKRQLEQQIQAETDDEKVKELEKKLARVEAELNQKNNDTYRRQNAVVS